MHTTFSMPFHLIIPFLHKLALQAGPCLRAFSVRARLPLLPPSRQQPSRWPAIVLNVCLPVGVIRR